VAPPVLGLVVVVPPADVAPPVSTVVETPLLHAVPVTAAKPKNATLKTTSLLFWFAAKLACA
jgi:hypothetical protein